MLTPQTAHCLQAVRKSAAPKAKPEKAEELKAETPKDKMNELIEASLKEAGLARTSAITLSGLDYAEDLSKSAAHPCARRGRSFQRGPVAEQKGRCHSQGVQENDQKDRNQV